MKIFATIEIRNYETEVTIVTLLIFVYKLEKIQISEH